MACLVFLPLALASVPEVRKAPPRKALLSGLPAAAGASEILPLKVRHDSALLRPRAAGSLRLLQALLRQLRQVLLRWGEGDKGKGEG